MKPAKNGATNESLYASHAFEYSSSFPGYSTVHLTSIDYGLEESGHLEADFVGHTAAPHLGSSALRNQYNGSIKTYWETSEDNSRHNSPAPVASRQYVRHSNGVSSNTWLPTSGSEFLSLPATEQPNRAMSLELQRGRTRSRSIEYQHGRLSTQQPPNFTEVYA
jgi:hypothetical protein